MLFKNQINPVNIFQIRDMIMEHEVQTLYCSHVKLKTC